MKAWRIPLITLGLAAALGTPAFAQTGPGMHGKEGQQGPRMEKMREFMAERHQKHLGELKTRLQIDPGQENAWKSFVQVMQPPAHGMARMDRTALEKLSTPERIDQMMAWHAEREADMKKRGEATKAFYAGLNAEQKKTFDAETAKYMSGRHGEHRHRH